MKRKWIEMYLDIADRIALESHAVRLKVGAVFVSPDGVMSTGINGLPAGSDNVCEDTHHSYDERDYKPEEGWIHVPNKGYYKTVTKPEVSHAEENLFQKLMVAGVSTKGGRIFLTHAPCIHCAKIIVGSGVTALHYRNDYRSTDGIDWLKKNHIEVNKE